MRTLVFGVSVVILLTLLGPLSGVAKQTPNAANATPEAVEGPITLVLVERADIDTKIDVGDPGQSTGDMQVWGPNALYDEANENDTGATVQGYCVMLDASGICVATETLIFADGSTLQLQGVQQANGETTSAIVGGTGQYLGAYGTEDAHPSEDFSLWTKTLTIWL